jgi:hypothetical protein
MCSRFPRRDPLGPAGATRLDKSELNWGIEQRGQWARLLANSLPILRGRGVLLSARLFGLGVTPGAAGMLMDQELTGCRLHARKSKIQPLRNSRLTWEGRALRYLNIQ